jgi:hypothetical protein
VTAPDLGKRNGAADGTGIRRPLRIFDALVAG